MKGALNKQWSLGSSAILHPLHSGSSTVLRGRRIPALNVQLSASVLVADDAIMQGTPPCPVKAQCGRGPALSAAMLSTVMHKLE